MQQPAKVGSESDIVDLAMGKSCWNPSRSATRLYASGNCNCYGNRTVFESQLGDYKTTSAHYMKCLGGNVCGADNPEIDRSLQYHVAADICYFNQL